VVIVGLDLLIANGTVNLTTTPAFYTLRPEVAKLVEDARKEGTYRFFAYGVRDDPSLRWSPAVARRNADVWLYYLDRQSLLPRTHVLDGLEAAFDEDRVGWSPAGSTIPARERFPWFYRQHHARIRGANVRFVVSFHPLPDDLVRLRGEARLPELLEPLRLYELRDPLPRSCRVERYETVPSGEALRSRLEAPDFDPRTLALLDADASPPSGPGPGPVTVGEGGGSPGIEFERLDPHTVRLRGNGPPGLWVVTEGYHPSWKAEAGGEPRGLWRANGRYWAIEARGGEEIVTVRFRPAWRPWATAATVTGALGVLALALIRRSQ
jgi:hypothetical protein